MGEDERGIGLHHKKSCRVVVGATSSRYDGKLSINSVRKEFKDNQARCFIFRAS